MLFVWLLLCMEKCKKNKMRAGGYSIRFGQLFFPMSCEKKWNKSLLPLLEWFRQVDMKCKDLN